MDKNRGNITDFQSLYEFLKSYLMTEANSLTLFAVVLNICKRNIKTIIIFKVGRVKGTNSTSLSEVKVDTSKQL